MIHIDAIYYIMLNKKTKLKHCIPYYRKHKYVIECSMMKNYLRRKYYKKVNIVNANEAMDFIVKYVNVA
jgi:hypothetical protein